MITIFTQELKIAKAQTKIVVSVWTSSENMGARPAIGIIEEIWELEYGAMNIPLFLQWVNLNGVKKDEYGMTIVDLTKIGFKDDPFVLAKDVHQVFYVKDMTSMPKNKNSLEARPQEAKRHIVLPGKRLMVGVEDKTDMIMIGLMACLRSLSKLTQAYCLDMKRHRTYMLEINVVM
jgi:hypothetical protein